MVNSQQISRDLERETKSLKPVDFPTDCVTSGTAASCTAQNVKGPKLIWEKKGGHLGGPGELDRACCRHL